MGRPDRHGIGEGKSRTDGVAFNRRKGPADVLHGAEPGFGDHRQRLTAKPGPIKFDVVGHHQIGSLEHGLKKSRPACQGWGVRLTAALMPLIGSAGSVLARQQKRHLIEHGPLGHVEQNGANLDAMVALALQARGFRIQDQEPFRQAAASRAWSKGRQLDQGRARPVAAPFAVIGFR
jgi:hypothetical protein